MGSWFSEREQRLVAGAETASAATPIPTQIVSNGEYLPPRQSETQKRVERRIFELADDNGKRLGLSRMADLQSLGSRLKLPAGWIFRTRIPPSPLTMIATGEAHIVQDDLENTYQSMTRAEQALPKE